MKIHIAVCVILDDYGRILLLHRNTSQRSHWELPGGKVEEYETPEQAAVREIDEELGVSVRLVNLLDADVFEDNGQEYQCSWFRAVVTEADPLLRETKLFDDLDYFEVEDLPSLALATGMQVLLDKIITGEVALEA